MFVSRAIKYFAELLDQYDERDQEFKALQNEKEDFEKKFKENVAEGQGSYIRVLTEEKHELQRKCDKWLEVGKTAKMKIQNLEREKNELILTCNKKSQACQEYLRSLSSIETASKTKERELLNQIQALEEKNMELQVTIYQYFIVVVFFIYAFFF